MTTEDRDALTAVFKRLVHDKADEVDSSQEQDWYSLTLGFALGYGWTPSDAHEFATYIRYQTNLG